MSVEAGGKRGACLRRIRQPPTGRLSAQKLCYTDSVERNLTLTVDDGLLRAARKVALDRGTSVNQLVREFLARMVGEADRRKAAIERIDEIFRTSRIEVGRRSWTRGDLHER